MREKLWTTSGRKPAPPAARASVLSTVSRRDSELSPGQGKNASVGHVEPGSRHQSDRVARGAQPADQHVDDALDAAVEARRDLDLRIGGEQ